MSSVSIREIERQYRVLGQTLDMHAMLRDEYSFKANITQAIILFCSVIFCATVFASDQFFETLNLAPQISRSILKIVSVLAVAFSIITLIFDWRGKSALHREAVHRWSIALQDFREHRKEDGAWPEEILEQLSRTYWEANKNTVKIPYRRFNALKSRYLKKVEISKLKSIYPACPRMILLLMISGRDSYRAISGCSKLDAKKDEF